MLSATSLRRCSQIPFLRRLRSGEIRARVGVDYGKCLLSDLKPSKPFDVDGHEVRPQRVTNSVTVLGRPVVGAARMVAAAGPHQILWNEYPGQELYRTRSSLSQDARVRRVTVPNKDLHEELQFAYLFGHKKIDDILEHHLRPNGATP